MTPTDWISRLNLLPHPEGGFYKEVYRSSFHVIPQGHATTGSCTSIYYLLQDKDFSVFHRLAYPEIWYFHDGNALDIHAIDPSGKYSVTRLGKNPGENLSLVVEPGVWFAAEIPVVSAPLNDREQSSSAGYALVSCAVAPAFDFELFEMGKREELIREWPEHSEVLIRLCRD